MKIWKKEEISTKILNERNQGYMSDHLGIVFTEIVKDFVIAKMPVNKHTMQPNKIMHGGASCALAETVASVAANYCVDSNKLCVGQSIFTNHIRPAKDGFVFAKAFPIHLGRKTHIWQINITSDSGKSISQTQLTLIVIEKSHI